MAYVDFNAEGAAAALDGHEICIVGAGAAGILLAVRLAAQGRRVLLIETGHLSADEERQSLNVIEQTGKPMSNPVWNRKRIVGGTTTAWGGQSLPFAPLDFEPRDWVANSGWPLTYREIEPYYAAANTFMGIDSWNYHSDLYPRLGFEPPAVDPLVLDFHCSKWAREPNFRKRHEAALKARVTVLFNAHLTRIDLGADGRVAALAIADFSGRTSRMAIGQVIIAAGGIETNRILLLNDHQVRGGLGGGSGWLGRAFMDHPSVSGGVLVPRDLRSFQRLFGTHVLRLRRYSMRLSASAHWQRSRQMLNVSSGFLFFYPEERDDPLFGAKRLLRQKDLRGIAHIVRSLPKVAASARSVMAEGFLYKPGSAAAFAVNVEQEPTRDSHIALADATDRFGLRKVRLHWTISEKSWRTTVAFTQAIKAQMEALGLAQVRLASCLTDENPDWSNAFSDVNHHMGGTRMSAAAADGVVNPDLQVWGIPNLHVASSSVFPTSSHSNPTLTLLALCERLVRKFETYGAPPPLSRRIG